MRARKSSRSPENNLQNALRIGSVCIRVLNLLNHMPCSRLFTRITSEQRFIHSINRHRNRRRRYQKLGQLLGSSTATSRGSQERNARERERRKFPFPRACRMPWCTNVRGAQQSTDTCAHVRARVYVRVTHASE